MAYFNKLSSNAATFADLMNGFGVVTVMNAKIYEFDKSVMNNTAEGIRDAFAAKEALAEIDTLKVANVTVEGPDKTITGGQYSNPLIKYGKSARLEMQDALGSAKAIEAFGGSINEYEEETFEKVAAMHITEDFASAKTIIGDSFFIDRKSGQQVKVNVVFYQVQPDSIFNLTQDAEGDATVFDMNADLLVTEIKMNDAANTVHGVFYSIIPAATKVSE